jgi:hypothetical protein
MENNAIELWRATVVKHSEEVSPQLQEMRRRLVGYLAVSGALPHQLAEEESIKRRNLELLSNLAHLLPAPETVKRSGLFRSEFHTEDPILVRTLQQNTVWYLDSPRYVIGSRTFTDAQLKLIRKRLTRRERYIYRDVEVEELLLADPRNGSISISKSTKESSVAAKLEAIQRSEYPTPDDAKKIFDYELRKYVVDHTAPSSTEIGYARDVKSISDSDLALFQVNSYMDRLATEFGIEGEVGEVLTKYQAELTQKKAL